MSFRTDYSKYELTYGENGRVLELCTGGGSETTAPEDVSILRIEEGGRRLEITADSRAKFILGVTLEGNPKIIRRKPGIRIAQECQMVMSRLFQEEYEEGEPLDIYFDSNIVYVVIGGRDDWEIRYQTYDPLLEYTFQYDDAMRLRCIQLVLKPQQRENFFSSVQEDAEN